MPPVMTGIVLCSRHKRCKPAPPRGMIMSTYWSRRSSSVTSARSGSAMYCTAAPGRPARSKRRLDDVRQRQVAAQRLAAAAQDGRIAGLEAQRGHVDRHVGPGLVDHADHADGDAPLAQAQAVGQHPALELRADRVGQGGDAPARRRPARRCASPSSSRRSSIASLNPAGRPSAMSCAFCARTSAGLALQLLGNRQQRPVFDLCPGDSELPAGGPGRLSDLNHIRIRLCHTLTPGSGRCGARRPVRCRTPAARRSRSSDGR